MTCLINFCSMSMTAEIRWKSHKFLLTHILQMHIVKWLPDFIKFNIPPDVTSLKSSQEHDPRFVLKGIVAKLLAILALNDQFIEITIVQILRNRVPILHQFLNCMRSIRSHFSKTNFNIYPTFFTIFLIFFVRKYFSIFWFKLILFKKILVRIQTIIFLIQEKFNSIKYAWIKNLGSFQSITFLEKSKIFLEQEIIVKSVFALIFSWFNTNCFSVL